MPNLPHLEVPEESAISNDRESIRIFALKELAQGCEAMEKNHFIELLPTPGIANKKLSDEILNQYANLQEQTDEAGITKFRFEEAGSNDAMVIKDGRVYGVGTKFAKDNGMFSIFYDYDTMGRITKRESFVWANTYTETYTYESDTPNEDGIFEYKVDIKHTPGYR